MSLTPDAALSYHITMVPSVRSCVGCLHQSLLDHSLFPPPKKTEQISNTTFLGACSSLYLTSLVYQHQPPGHSQIFQQTIDLPITHSSQPQTPLNPFSNLPLKLPSPFPPHLRRLHISRTLIIRLGQHAHYGDQDLLHRLYRGPSLRGLFVMHRIIAGSM